MRLEKRVLEPVITLSRSNLLSSYHFPSLHSSILFCHTRSYPSRSYFSIHYPHSPLIPLPLTPPHTLYSFSLSPPHLTRFSSSTSPPIFAIISPSLHLSYTPSSIYAPIIYCPPPMLSLLVLLHTSPNFPYFLSSYFCLIPLLPPHPFLTTLLYIFRGVTGQFRNLVSNLELNLKCWIFNS